VFEHGPSVGQLQLEFFELHVLGFVLRLNPWFVNSSRATDSATRKWIGGGHRVRRQLHAQPLTLPARLGVQLLSLRQPQRVRCQRTLFAPRLRLQLCKLRHVRLAVGLGGRGRLRKLRPQLAALRPHSPFIVRLPCD
jgi:hypothetical protein